MSKLHQGVLRAVRLLPDVVKIGVEPETALPSDPEEELSKKGQPSPGEEQSSGLSEKKQPEVSKTKEEPAQAPVTDALKEMQNLISSLETQLRETKAREQALAGKVSALEADLSTTRSVYVQKERELAAGAEAVKAQARAEGKAQGHDEGLQKGYDEGLRKAQGEIEEQYRENFSSLVGALEGISAGVEKHFAELVELNQPRMLRLWHNMLKKMLQREIAMTPDGISDVLTDVLSRVSDKNHILIYVSPDDVELLKKKLDGEFGDILRGVKHLELKPDAHVDKGSCIVETNLGVYDARWRTQFEQIDTVVEDLFQKLVKAPQPKAVEENEVKEEKEAKGSRTRQNKKKQGAQAKNA